MNTRKVKLTIMVVDDEFIFRELNKRRIESFLKNKVLYEIFIASGFQNALEIAKNRSIDIVLTDMYMDGREDSGLFLADKIKAFNNHTEIFIVSNAYYEHIEKQTHGLNISGFFQQPLREVDIESAFRNFLQAHKKLESACNRQPNHSGWA